VSTPLLRARALVRSFGQTRALQGLSLEVGPGDLYGLVGPDGAGKTTAMRIFAGLMAPDSGEVRVLGHDPLKGAASFREAVGYMPQQYSLYGDLSVAENLHFFARLFGLPRRVEHERSARLLEITRLGPFRDRRAEALSGGMYKKLALATALLHRPRLLLLDEPTNGVDPVSRRELWALLHDFLAEGMAVVVCTPYMDEAARCHRVGLIRNGKLIAEGEPAALTAGFEHEVFEVTGGEREAVLAILDGNPAVLARSPAGARLRAVVARGESGSLREALAGAGAALVPVPPDFEDLFIARAREVS
jgi:ABC-2 type transport system ATP-binding protein